jgi:phenylpropionate dioxygenase-like ring-hydroxylating dioxygenase large terminal subunit
MATKVRSKDAEWHPPTPPENRNYPYNCWWVAGFSSEIGRELLARWLLDTPVLLYRTEDGRAVAIENRCSHRSAPLSLGCLNGDNVQCGYHGFTFAPDGACVRVPSTNAPLPAASIRSFPVIEQNPFVWVYLGDPERIDDVPPPHSLDWVGDDSFEFVTGRMDVAANYMLLKENVLDLTHFGYVHATSFGITDWVDPPKLVMDGDRPGYHQSFVRSPLPSIFAKPLGVPTGTPFNRNNYGSFVSPALQIAAVDFIGPENSEVIGRFRVGHATTPTDPGHMHYFYVIARDFGNSAEDMQELLSLTEIGFAEDEEMIEAVQTMIARDPRGTAHTEVSVKADAPGIQARRALQSWMERETA